jgi:hypothetical protein
MTTDGNYDNDLDFCLSVLTSIADLKFYYNDALDSSNYDKALIAASKQNNQRLRDHIAVLRANPSGRYCNTEYPDGYSEITNADVANDLQAILDSYNKDSDDDINDASDAGTDGTNAASV